MKDEAELGVGLIGTGLAARMHAAALQRVTGVRLVAVAGSSPAKALAFADEWQVPRAYGSLPDLLADPAVDAVHLCTPPYLREPFTCAAADAGKHVLVDKPMARTLAEADRMIQTARTAGVQLGVVFQHRFMPLPTKLKDALARGQLGAIHLAEAHVKWWREPHYYAASPWRGTAREEGGGVLVNQAIHTIDLLQWLLGPASDVMGYTATGVQRIECEDTAVALIRFASGALATVAASTAAYPGFSERLELFGAGGSVVLAEGDGTLAWFRGDGQRWQDEQGGAAGASRDPAAAQLEGHVAQFADFASAVRSGRAPAVDGGEGRKALEIVRAIYLAHRRRAPVHLPLESDQ